MKTLTMTPARRRKLEAKIKDLQNKIVADTLLLRDLRRILKTPDGTRIGKTT
jgi:hypothetical protein